MIGHRGFAVAVACVALAGLVVLAAGAAAGERLKTSQAKTTVGGAGSSNAGSASARCRKPASVVSGGWSGPLVAEGTSSKLVAPTKSIRVGRRLWRMEGVNLGQASSEITIYAYCRKQGLKTRQVKKTLSASAPPTYTSQQVTARCPRGMTLVSGGVGQSQLDLIPPETFVGLVSRSKRVNRRTWSVKAFNSGDDSGDLIAQANCAKGRALKQRQASRSFGESPGQASLQARCRRSERVISGGFEWTGSPAGQLAVITTFRKQGTRSWIAQAYGVDTTLTITAYCERK